VEGEDVLLITILPLFTTSHHHRGMARRKKDLPKIKSKQLSDTMIDDT
jgi:hypothetical protein